MNYARGGSRIRLETERNEPERIRRWERALFLRREFELVSHTNQLNKRPGLHLLHDVAPMNFDRGLTGADFGGNVLVEHAGDHEGHHFLLARGQRLITLVQGGDLGLLLSRRAVPLKG